VPELVAGTAAYMMNVYSTALATIGVRSVRPSSLSKHGRSGALLSVGRWGVRVSWAGRTFCSPTLRQHALPREGLRGCLLEVERHW
jgi:hypothetical protein